MPAKESNYCVDCGGKCRMNHITGIPGVRVVSPSRIFNGNLVGKPLTDRTIAKYEALGCYGAVMKLPAKTGSRCSHCNGTIKVKHRTWSYLPHDGYYCEPCVLQFRAQRDKEKELAARIRAAQKTDYI
jgi:late competence protein required for DNA uptake (superfamily II DNA/RNA helicase)